jgi:hypothetical protein
VAPHLQIAVLTVALAVRVVLVDIAAMVVLVEIKANPQVYQGLLALAVVVVVERVVITIVPAFIGKVEAVAVVLDCLA